MDKLNISTQSKKLQNYMRHYNDFELTFSEFIITYDSQIDHIWTSC